VAVLACGVDRAYPSAHRQLIDYIADVGLVVSELPLGCAPTRLRFLARNRLIAAFGQGTVVVEAAARSGALNTANWTARLHRMLMGVPGPVTSAQSQGVHELVRSRDAFLVTGPADVLELVSPSGSFTAPALRGETTERDGLGEEEQRVLDALPVVHGVSTTSVARTAGLAESQVTKILDLLCQRGFAERVEGVWRLSRDALARETPGVADP
jgi:DNA processing protein